MNNIPFHFREKVDRFEMTLASFLARRSRASRIKINSALSVTKQLVAPVILLDSVHNTSKCS